MRTVCNTKRIFIPWILIGLLVAAGDSLAVANEPNVTLKVTTKTERNKEKSEKIRSNASGNDRSAFTETETETCTLFVEVRMLYKPTLDCQLEWFFLSENVKSAKDKRVPVIFSPGKKTLSLEESVWQEETITSAPFVITTISNDRANVDDKVSGDKYEGYIVLVTQGGNILAKASNSSRYLKEEWISKCKNDGERPREKKKSKKK